MDSVGKESYFSALLFIFFKEKNLFIVAEWEPGVYSIMAKTSVSKIDG